MRSLFLVCAVVSVLALTAGMANAANPGQVPNSTLAQLGLSGLQTMSDAQGADVRGMGFNTVSGYSSAPLGGVATAGYTAKSVGGSYNLAVGGDVTVSAAGKVYYGGFFAKGIIVVGASASIAVSK